MKPHRSVSRGKGNASIPVGTQTSAAELSSSSPNVHAVAVWLAPEGEQPGPVRVRNAVRHETSQNLAIEIEP